MKLAILSKALVRAAYRSKLDELAKLGVDVHAILPHRFGGDRFEESSNGRFSVVKKRLLLADSYHLSFYLGLAKTLRAIGPDVFHIDEEPYNLVTYQALAAAPTRRTVLFAWQNIDKTYPFPFSYFQASNLRSCRAVIAGSEKAAGVIRRAGFAGRVDVIPQFGVDPEVYRRARPPRRGELTVGFLGRLVPEKGLDLLLAAARGLPVRVLLCGDGPLRRKLQRQAERDAVDLVARPRVGSRDVPALLNSMDILVLPSRTTARWSEQFGRVLIEAMACEVPVVGSTAGEIPHVIGDAGLLFRAGDATDLKAKIVELIASAELRETLGRRGRQRVLERFTQERIARRTHEVYRALLETT